MERKSGTIELEDLLKGQISRKRLYLIDTTHHAFKDWIQGNFRVSVEIREFFVYNYIRHQGFDLRDIWI